MAFSSSMSWPVRLMRFDRETPVDMGGIIERAISALIDEQLIPATLLDLHDHRVELGREGTPGSHHSSDEYDTGSDRRRGGSR
jgi:hypothetical protein